MTLVDQHINEIRQLCAMHKVRHLYAFGSVLTPAFDQESDVDFIVDFNPLEPALYADNYFDFKYVLQDILNRPVDLLEGKAIKNPYFVQQLSRQKQLIYGD
jgi:uncharacterized protein